MIYVTIVQKFVFIVVLKKLLSRYENKMKLTKTFSYEFIFIWHEDLFWYVVYHQSILD